MSYNQEYINALHLQQALEQQQGGLATRGTTRKCRAIPDGAFVISIVLMAMIFTYFVVPLGIPDASLFRDGIPNDGYVIGSMIFQWIALLVALTLYYPTARSQRSYTPLRGAMCATAFQEDEMGTSLDPINALLLTYAVIKVFSFVIALASRNSATETQRLVRTVLALSELIILYMYVYNMSEYAKIRHTDRQRMMMGGRANTNRHHNYSNYGDSANMRSLMHRLRGY